jgi:hypothetical protein
VIVIAELAPQPSVAVTRLSFAAGTVLAHEYVASAGKVAIVGGVVPFTVKV